MDGTVNFPRSDQHSFVQTPLDVITADIVNTSDIEGCSAAAADVTTAAMLASIFATAITEQNPEITE